MSISSGVTNAILAGFFGSTAGVVTKVTFDKQKLTEMCQKWIINLDICENNLLIGQIIGVGMMILVNLLMFKHFNRALQAFDTSVEASLTTTAANILISAFFGWLFFSEKLSMSWWLGTFFIGIGILLINEKEEGKLKKTE